MKPLAHNELLDLVFAPSTLVKSSVFVAVLIELGVILKQGDKLNSLGELISSIEKSYRDMLERNDVPDDIKQNIRAKLDEINSLRGSG